VGSLTSYKSFDFGADPDQRDHALDLGIFNGMFTSKHSASAEVRGFRVFRFWFVVCLWATIKQNLFPCWVLFRWQFRDIFQQRCSCPVTHTHTHHIAFAQATMS